MSNIPLIGLGVLIINKHNQILLGRRIGAHGHLSWGPPGGHLEFGESFEECAIREVLEETALTIQEPKFLAITNDFFKEENKHYVSIFMSADYSEDQEIRNPEPHKVSQWQWFSFDALPSGLFLPLKHLVADKAYGRKLMFLKNENPEESY